MNLTQQQRTDIQNELDKREAEYQNQLNEAKALWDGELAMLEDEAAEVETDLDQQQVEIEAQLDMCETYEQKQHILKVYNIIDEKGLVK